MQSNKCGLLFQIWNETEDSDLFILRICVCVWQLNLRVQLFTFQFSPFVLHKKIIARIVFHIIIMKSILETDPAAYVACVVVIVGQNLITMERFWRNPFQLETVDITTFKNRKKYQYPARISENAHHFHNLALNISGSFSPNWLNLFRLLPEIQIFSMPLAEIC